MFLLLVMSLDFCLYGFVISDDDIIKQILTTRIGQSTNSMPVNSRPMPYRQKSSDMTSNKNTHYLPSHPHTHHVITTSYSAFGTVITTARIVCLKIRLNRNTILSISLLKSN